MISATPTTAPCPVDRWPKPTLKETSDVAKVACSSCLLPLAIIITLMGCTSRLTHAQAREGALARVGIINNTGNYIHSASVNGAGGGNMSAWGAASATVCCTLIPRVWYPSMAVRVRWNMPIGVKDVFKEKTVMVEKYDRLGDIYMNFFPNDEVRVVVSRNGPRAFDYPIPPAGEPKDDLSPNR